MLPSIAADERAALQFDELASGLEAGLPLASLGGDPGAGDRSVHEALAAHGIRLSPVEDAVLAAGVRAGRVPETLRQRAAQRRQRAEFTRELVAGLRYPLFLLLCAIATSLIVARFLGSYWLPIAIGAVLVLLAGGALSFRAGLRRGGGRWLAVPWLGPLAAEVGELPYLEALHALYASGVPIVEAHSAATGAVGIVDLRVRLRAAEQTLQAGAPLHEALAAHGVLHPESVQLLSTGERAGQLEEALHNALARRREVCGRRIRATVRWIGGILYAFAVVAVVYMILSFYVGYFRLATGR